MNRAERRASGVVRHPAVCFSYLHGGTTSAAFVASLIRCRDYEAVRTSTLFAVRERRARSGGIPAARNQLTAAFLESDAEWLWFVDADMGFPANALQVLLAAADKHDRPIMGGLCFALQAEGFDDETNAERFGMIPTIYLWKEHDGQIVGGECLDRYPRDAICKVDATGAACVLLHRAALEKMRDKFGPAWWTLLPQPNGTRTFGEDTSFFLRAYDCELPVHVHTGVRTSHDKDGIFLTEARWDEQLLLAEMKAAPDAVAAAS